jgi:uncharacterized protein involved in exopolysaccharide biosynthesis
MGPIQSLGEVLALLKRRIDVIAFIIGLGALFGLFSAIYAQPIYQSQAVISARLNTVSGDLANGGNANNTPARLLQLVEQRLTTRENMLALADKYNLFPERTPLERVSDMRASISFLSQAAITIGFANDGMLSSIVIQARTSDATQAAELANELADMLIEQTGAGREARARETVEFLREQQAALQAEIENAENDMRRFATENTEVMPFNVEIRRAELLQIGTAIQAAESEVAALQAALEGFRAQGSTQRRMIQTREELAARQADLDRLRAQRTDLEPFFIRMAAVERELEGMNQRIERSRDMLRDIVNQLALAESNLRLETSQQIAAYEIVETAAPSDYPISRSRKTTLLIFVAGAVIMALVLPFAWEVIRPALRSPGQVERETGMRAVMVLPELVVPSQRRKMLVARLAGLTLFALAVVAAIMTHMAR